MQSSAPTCRLFILLLLQTSTPSAVRRAKATTAPTIHPITIDVLWPPDPVPSAVAPIGEGGEDVGPLDGLALGCWAAEEGEGGTFAAAGGGTAAEAAVMGARAGAS